MAEFNEVIMQFKRMCRYTNHSGLPQDCPLYCKGHGCNISHCRMLAFYDKKFQKEVMTWAAKHPEPVFPSWMEWLMDNVPGVDADSSVDAVLALCRAQIPADIAKKLAIEPKEG